MLLVVRSARLSQIATIPRKPARECCRKRSRVVRSTQLSTRRILTVTDAQSRLALARAHFRRHNNHPHRSRQPSVCSPCRCRQHLPFANLPRQPHSRRFSVSNRVYLSLSTALIAPAPVNAYNSDEEAGQSVDTGNGGLGAIHEESEPEAPRGTYTTFI